LNLALYHCREERSKGQRHDDGWAREGAYSAVRRCASGTNVKALRRSPGVSPKVRLKTRPKWDWSENPQTAAISISDLSEPDNNSTARSSLLFMTNWLGVRRRQKKARKGIGPIPRNANRGCASICGSSGITHIPFRAFSWCDGIDSLGTSGGDRSVNAVWTYETPFEAMAQIKEYVAFYPDRVDEINVIEAGAPGFSALIGCLP